MTSDSADKTSRATILVVEDEPAVRKLAARTLGRASFTVVLAANGREGLELLDKDIDLVLLDMNMPEIDGPTFISRLAERRLEVPVLATSGYTQVSAVDHYGGPLQYIAKPYRPRELVARIETVLGLATEA